MNKKLAILFVAALAVALFFGFLDSRPCVTVIQDASFQLVYPESAMKDFKKALGKVGYKLKVVTLDGDTLLSESDLTQALEKEGDAKLMLCTPVVSAAVLINNLPVKEFSDCLTVGIAEYRDGCFDFILESDMSGFTAEDGIDYRDTLGNKEYEKVICPDFKVSVIPLLDFDKNDMPVDYGVLYYETR